MTSVLYRAFIPSPSPVRQLAKLFIRHRHGGRFKGVVETTNPDHGGNVVWNKYTYKKYVKEHAIEQMNQDLVKYPFVQKVRPRSLHKYFTEELKIRYLREDTHKKEGVELLQNISNKHDSWIIRNNMAMLYYYRIEMLQQRLDYLKDMQMLPEEKLANIRAHPPLLLFSFDAADKQGNLMYLRGLVQDDIGGLVENLPSMYSEYLHVFYPVTKEVTLKKPDLDARLASIQDSLELKQFSALAEVMRLPCLFMDPALMQLVKPLFVHRFSMPFQFNIDSQTMSLLPPILNLNKMQLNPENYFTNAVSKQQLLQLPLYQLPQCVDYSYKELSTYMGTPALECMSAFLLRAEKEEQKDRFNGQAIRGRRGFNVPKRQY